jgi:hypothetical protein
MLFPYKKIFLFDFFAAGTHILQNAGAGMTAIFL